MAGGKITRIVGSVNRIECDSWNVYTDEFNASSGGKSVFTADEGTHFGTPKEPENKTGYFVKGWWTDKNDKPIKEAHIGDIIRFNIHTRGIEDGEKVVFTVYDWDFWNILNDKLTLSDKNSGKEITTITIQNNKGFIEWATGVQSLKLLDEILEGDEIELFVECRYKDEVINLPYMESDYLVLYEKEVLITVIIELPMENYDYSNMGVGEKIVAKSGLLGHTAVGIDEEYYDYGPEKKQSVLRGNISESTYGDLNKDGDTIDNFNGIDDPKLKDSGLNQGSYGDPMGTLGRPWWDKQFSTSGNATLKDIMTILKDDYLRRKYGILGEVHMFEIEVKESQSKVVKQWWENKYNRNLGIYSVNIMEDGEHCTSTVYHSLLEAKIIKRFPLGTICTPKTFLNHLKKSMLINTAGNKKGELVKETILKDLS